jgi:predicted acetyltransferase
MILRIRLISPSVEYEGVFLEFMREFVEDGNRRYVIMYPAARDDFARYIKRLERAARSNRLQPRFVPETTFWLQRDDGYMLGSCRLRHKLNRALKHEGGHIGYDIRPSERGRGYGTLQLRLLLGKAKGLGMRRVLVTCDTDNYASARVIEKNHGELENQVLSHITGKQVNRYWIEL